MRIAKGGVGRSDCLLDSKVVDGWVMDVVMGDVADAGLVWKLWKTFIPIGGSHIDRPLADGESLRIHVTRYASQ